MVSGDKIMKVLKESKYIILLFAIGVLLGVKAIYGFGWDDEGYYLSIVHRFYMGEIPMYDEWYPSQLSGVLLLPVYFLFKIITGSGEGVVLFFRWFYLFVLLLDSVFVYAVISKWTKKPLIAFFSAAFLLIYSTENKALFSYSDLAVVFVSLAMVSLIAKDAWGSKKRYLDIFSGMCYVCALFANPYLIVVYVYMIIVTAVKYIVMKNKECIFDLLAFTVGCCLIGFAFIGYLLGNASIGDLIKSFGYFMNFPGHAAKNVLVDLVKWFWYVIKPYSIPLIGLQVILFGYVLFGIYKRRITMPKKILFGIEMICAISYILIQYFFMDDKNVIGIAYIPLAILALFCFLMTINRDWKIFCIIYLPGMLMSIAYQCSSDTGIFAITTGFVVSAIASVVMIYGFVQENDMRVMNKSCWILLLIILVYTGIIRVSYCRYNEFEEVYNARMENGPYKGIITDEKQKQYYEESLKDIEVIETNVKEDDTVLILGNNMWMYLCLDRCIGAPTTWRMTIDHEYFAPYFEMHADKKPEIIYANELAEEYKYDSLILQDEVYPCVYQGRGKIYSK